jgi:hypothetical protein
MLPHRVTGQNARVEKNQEIVAGDLLPETGEQISITPFRVAN